MNDKSESASAGITLRGLVKKYHYQPVLNELNLTVEEGGFCILVGANGAGKTTLLRIIASLVRPDAGEVIIGGEIACANPQSRSRIGYVGHQPMFYQDLTASENLLHYAHLYQIAHADEVVEKSIQSAGLARHVGKPLRAYSRGMQQRLSLIRALLHDPAILLLDEPYTGLDREAAHFLDDRLRSLYEAGRTILLAAHRPQRLLSIASHIAWLKDGRIIQHLPAARLSESLELEKHLQEVA